MLSLVYKQQEHPHWCGPAVLQMVMAFWGDSVSQEKLATMLGTTEEAGTDEDDMERVVRELGYEIVEDEGTIDDIRTCIQKGIPVIVAFIEPINDEGHYSVVTDINDEEIVLSDPEIDRYPTIILPVHDFWSVGKVSTHNVSSGCWRLNQKIISYRAKQKHRTTAVFLL